MTDWNKVALLLDVIYKAAIAGPAYSWFSTQASIELLKMQPTAGSAPLRRSAGTDHE